MPGPTYSNKTIEYPIYKGCVFQIDVSGEQLGFWHFLAKKVLTGIELGGRYKLVVESRGNVFHAGDRRH